MFHTIVYDWLETDLNVHKIAIRDQFGGKFYFFGVYSPNVINIAGFSEHLLLDN
jgi:hypothetical protein